MAILLKEQLRILHEGVHYSVPFKLGPKGFNVLNQGRKDSVTRKMATQMFYDFYAMELMHRLLGSPLPDPEVPLGHYDDSNVTPKMTTQQKAKMKTAASSGLSSVFPVSWGDVEFPTMGGTIVPSALRKVIDQVYEEVVLQLTDKMMVHLRLGLIQEFRYIITKAQAWQSFRLKLLSIYNKNGGNISNEEFEQAVQTKIPKLKGELETVKRLLKFCKYYSAMLPDPADALPKKVEPTKIETPSKHTHKTSEPEPEPKTPEEPDDTDYDMPPVEIPPGADWGDEPYKHSDEIEKLKMIQWLKTHKNLSESNDDSNYAKGRISSHTILGVRQAINKSGLTWNDIFLAYTRLDWGGAWGGAKWGAGVESYIKLLAQTKNHNIEDMASIIDHIYDLEHNTGALLNKGGMYIAPEDLDRRSKVTHLARYLKDVSPLIQRLILRVLPYVSPHPEIDKNPEVVTSSPTIPMPLQVQTALTDSKFSNLYGGNEWITQAPFENKKGNSVQNQYTAKYHTNGMYSIEDSLKTDIQIFEKMEDFEKWLKQNSSNFIMPLSGISNYSIPKAKSEKQVLLEKNRIKLDDAKETILLEECKMAWRPSQYYYKAYLPNNDRFQFFAFDDWTFMGCVKSTANIGGVFDNWPAALTYCKAQTVDALPIQDYEAPMSITPKSGLSPFEITIFTNLADQTPLVDKNIGKVDVMPTSDKDCGIIFTIFPPDGLLHVVLTIEKSAVEGTGKIYIVTHNIKNLPKEKWNFPNFNQTYNFVSKNWNALMQSNTPVANTVITSYGWPTSGTSQPSDIPFPPPSPSKATYKAHVGIAKPPTHTIRLTQEDEDLLKNIGFHPQMQGADVWYVHNKLHDVVKFFPNDQAKILLPQENTKATVTKTIDNAIAWLISKYSGATVSPIVATSAPSTKGSKAGMLYEKPLAVAGFVWDNMVFEYVNVSTDDTIKIFPYPKSTYTDGSTGKTMTFNSLPELAVFIKNLGPKTMTIADPTSNLEGDYPLTQKDLETITSMIGKAGFVYDKASEGNNGYIYIKTSPSEKVEVFPQGHVVFEIKGVFGPIVHPNSEDFITWFSNVYETGNVQKKASDFANIIFGKLAEQGWIDPTTGNVVTSNALAAIKYFRQQIMYLTGGKCGLSNAKYVIENLPTFLEFVKQNGLPDMDGNSNNFYSNPPKLTNGIKPLASNDVEPPKKWTTGDDELDKLLTNSGFQFIPYKDDMFKFYGKEGSIIFYNPKDHSSQVVINGGSLSFVDNESLKDHLQNTSTVALKTFLFNEAFKTAVSLGGQALEHTPISEKLKDAEFELIVELTGSVWSNNDIFQIVVLSPKNEPDTFKFAWIDGGIVKWDSVKTENDLFKAIGPDGKIEGQK